MATATSPVMFLSSRAGLLNLLWGAGNFEKIWSVIGQHEIQFLERRIYMYVHVYIHTIIRIIFPAYFSVKIHWAKLSLF